MSLNCGARKITIILHRAKLAKSREEKKKRHTTSRKRKNNAAARRILRTHIP